MESKEEEGHPLFRSNSMRTGEKGKKEGDKTYLAKQLSDFDDLTPPKENKEKNKSRFFTLAQGGGEAESPSEANEEKKTAEADIKKPLKSAKPAKKEEDANSVQSVQSGFMNKNSNIRKVVLEKGQKKDEGDPKKMNKWDDTKSIKSQGHMPQAAKKSEFVLPYAHLVYGNIKDKEQFNKFMLITFKGVYYAKQVLKKAPPKAIESKKVFLDLPKNEKEMKPVMLLDLDETVIVNQQGATPGSITLKIPGKDQPIYTKIRPYAKDFLEAMSKLFYIFIFTAANDFYATAIVDYLDPNATFIRGIISRDNCLQTRNGYFIKDLRIITNCDLKRMVIVDNLTHSFSYQLENGIPIMEWNPEAPTEDTELLGIQKYLKELAKAKDIPEFNRKNLNLEKMADFKIEELFIH